MQLSETNDMKIKMEKVFLVGKKAIEYRWEAEIQSKLMNVIGKDSYGKAYVIDEYYAKLPDGMTNKEGYAFDIIVTNNPKEIVAIELKFIRHNKTIAEDNFALKILDNIFSPKKNRSQTGWAKTNYERFEKDVTKLLSLKKHLENKKIQFTGYAIFITDTEKLYRKENMPLLDKSDAYHTVRHISHEGWTSVGNYAYALLKV